MVKRFLNRKILMTVAVVLVASVSLSACDTLRKKFTRQKKQDQSQSPDFIPVLEPQDYPAPENNPVENYKLHYALIKAWYKDLWTAIDDKNSDKMVKNSIKQILDHIAQMKPSLKTQKAQGLNQLADLLKYYNTSLNDPRPMRNYARIESDLRAFDRMLRDRFRDDHVKGDFINQ
ncbi:MAG: hypothetical protein HY209_05155 [Candidatus Omnitrophica bacterium]|nr:hypothetical protein [Candidatus Omnitrophota bacterium]